ncbi:MAG: DUF4215 domain-containing protein [Myxococcales bacterium]|jgi:cysteine-rich repeat protein
MKSNATRTLRSLLWPLAALLASLALTTCIEPSSTECSTGVVCPPGKRCAKNQPVCIVDACGDGVVQEGEVCDDGNVEDGDGCSANCLSNETCGNDVVDTAVGEVCDDGNTEDGDDCSADCRSTEVCGNGIVDEHVGEVCDDGNKVSGDGCRSDCLSDETCGNGKLDTHKGELCDDGNNVDGDGCAADCSSNERCGNGIVDLTVGEQCDDGLEGVARDTESCNVDCTFPRCGDRHTNTEFGEECDDGEETARCNANCKLSRCGDKEINRTAGEVCDDGNTVSGDGCSGNCLSTEYCGNGYIDTVKGEVCDEGGVDTASCDGDCTAVSCGDGRVNRAAGEECDDEVETARCNADCTLAACGDEEVNQTAGEVCDDGNNEDGDGCSADCKSTETCGNRIVDDTKGEECDEGGVDTVTCNHDCTFARCGDGYANAARGETCDDGGESATCNANCTQSRCGDGVRNETAGEVCDDDNVSSGDGCSADCKSTEFCGNGYVDAVKGETCDEGIDGVPRETAECNINCTTTRCGDRYINTAAGEVCDDGAETARCNADCTEPRCGDGKLNRAAGEVCDDENNEPGDGCSADCRSEEDCGNGVVDPGEECDLGSDNHDQGDCLTNCWLNVCGDGIVNLVGPFRIEECDDAGESADCNVDCTLAACGDGIVNASAGEQCDVLGGGDTQRCNHDCTIALCGDGYHNAAADEECDDGGESESCNYNCTAPRCGDRILNRSAGEECDDGGESNRCNADCSIAFCGDGILNATRGELCDDAGESEDCNLDCTPADCGDGKINRAAGEQCDNLGALDSASCNANCTYAFCGDGYHNPAAGEQCDDAGNSPDCNANCTIAACGDGILNPAAGEECDTFVDTASCNGNCKQHRCGDGYHNPAAGEQCDTGGESATCNADCTTPRCGDGKLNTTFGEQCDTAGESATCNADCTTPRCGDGKLNTTFGEQCDDGGESQACNLDCSHARCGDGKLNVTAGEECDEAGETAQCNADCTEAACGDGKLNLAAGEECDDGNAVTETRCPDGEPDCLICDATCHEVPPSGYCGDGVHDLTSEACDDGNADACGTCSANCATEQWAKATGSLTTPKKQKLNNHDWFRLSDGTNIVEFEFRRSDSFTAHPSRVVMDIRSCGSGDQGIPCVCSAIRNAINGALGSNFGIRATYQGFGAIVRLENKQEGAFGNVTIDKEVGTRDFRVSGMGGGLGRDCGRGVGCTQDRDCERGLSCLDGVCQPPSFPLTVVVSGSGTVTSDVGDISCPGTCQATYEEKTSVELSATPDTGWHLAGWSEPECEVDESCVVLINASTEVTATFERNLYPVGGTLSGLADGATLVLENNGGDSLTLSSDGEFSFATPLAFEASYTVTVATQPSSPPQTCTVTNGSGTVGAGAVTSVQVTCVSLWSIGGTVSGLADGASVVLQNNLGDDLTVSANGSFAFATLLLNGSAYSVTVLTPPAVPSQTCSVESGAGTATGNVSNVKVTCVTNRYTIGGTVSGLVGSGLVLQNNGGDDLAISANGEFTFGTSVPSGGTYLVSVLTEPSDPPQDCTITNESGTVGGAPVTNVAVTCRTLYSVGGTVSGLSGSGLVLQNGADEIAVAAGQTSFVFPTLLLSGASYDVTVKAQPADPSQTCSVTNGSSTIATANVSDVQITCTTDTFGIGGTINGLTGSGLVLQNNGGDDLPIDASATSFLFATEIESGAAYAVTVATHPAGQFCTVANGAGTVGAADIASVVVSCVDTHRVGVTVTGLKGRGLVLQNNNEDDLAIEADGDYTFSKPIPEGGPYVVSVLTHPTSPGQVCTVTDGSGTMGGADVTGIQVTCSTKTYSIGVTVTGLAGLGLVLQNNGGDDLPIASDGDYTFATKVADQASYAVSVSADPSNPNQTCTVNDGSGTVDGADVTGITVTCVTNTYPVSVTVTGLAGSGLVLQNNDGDDLPVAADGNFTFATEIIDGGAYKVTVLTQPSIPDQTCEVTGGEGTVDGAPVTGVAVACVTNTYALSVGKTGNGSGRVASTPAGIDCATGCGSASFGFASHTVVLLTAEPDVGSVFYGWSGDCTGLTCELTMDAAKSVIAMFTDCGDGVVEGAEECDDGDLDDGDGCSAACAVEAEFTCSGAPSTCTNTCHDGAQNGDELGVDCGGACLACDGAACASDAECRSGSCVDNACAAAYRHTLTIDGTGEFTAAEQLATTSPGYTAYVTWDADNLYLGFEGPDIDLTDGASDTKWLMIYLDTDPGAATGASTGFTYNSRAPTFPAGFGAEYHFGWKTGGDNYVNKKQFTAGWEDATATFDWQRAGNLVEIRIPRADLGANIERLGISMFMHNEDSSGRWSYAALYAEGWGLSTVAPFDPIQDADLDPITPAYYLLADFRLARDPSDPASKQP